MKNTKTSINQEPTPIRTVPAFIGVGSNIGNRLLFCQKAVAAFRANPVIQVRQISSLYETEPVDYLNQGSFYNAVIGIETSFSPERLLQYCQHIEQDLGKKIEIPKGPRTLDLDLLFYGERIMTCPELILPHPEAVHRLFVLIPLAEIAPHWIHPQRACSIETLLQHFEPDRFKDVEKRFEPGWENPEAQEMAS